LIQATRCCLLKYIGCQNLQLHKSRLLQAFSGWSIILQYIAFEFLSYRLYIMNLTRNINGLLESTEAYNVGVLKIIDQTENACRSRLLCSCRFWQPMYFNKQHVKKQFSWCIFKHKYVAVHAL
jgi:hypothetical protein